MANDLFGALKTYLSKVSSGDKSPQELAAALNNWARESGEALKMRIEEEVEKTVKRMGLVKKSDLAKLEADIEVLKKSIGLSGKPKVKTNIKRNREPKKDGPSKGNASKNGSAKASAARPQSRATAESKPKEVRGNSQRAKSLKAGNANSTLRSETKKKSSK